MNACGDSRLRGLRSRKPIGFRQWVVHMTGTTVDYILEGVNKYMLALAKEQIKICFEQAEKEVKDLRRRTIEGIETARLNGKQIGRAAGTKIEYESTKQKKREIYKYSSSFNGMLKDKEVIKLLGISRNSSYKYKREIKEEIGWRKCVEKEPIKLS